MTKRFTVTVECDGAAFEEAFCEELSRILSGLAERVWAGTYGGTLRDYNGNTVGEFGLVSE